MDPLATGALRFGPFEVPDGVDLLYRAGGVVPLEPRAVRLLRYLAERHSRVVSKEELLERVWPGVVTTDDALKKAVQKVRRALGDEAGHARYVETYHGRGYRFVAPVLRDAGGTDGQAGAPPAVASIPLADLRVAVAAPPGRAADGPPRASGEPDFDQLVGRDGDVEALRAAYREALRGRGQAVVVLGEPGIGKTQLARHFGRWARGAGARWLYARFFDYEGSQLAPYEALLDLLRDGLAEDEGRPAGVFRLDDEALRRAVEARYGVSLPDELLAPAGATPAAMPPSDRFRIVAALGLALRRLGAARPLVLVLDDLHWADETGRDLVGYLMRTAAEDRVFLVALARDEEAGDAGHPFAQWLREQAGYRVFTTLTLAPLDETAVGRAVEAVFGGPEGAPDVPRADVRALHRLTGGNPYFLAETLRLLLAEGSIRRADARWAWGGLGDVRLPTSVALAALARLDRLPPDVRALVDEAAVIGDEFRVATLALAAERGNEEVERLLEEAVRHGVLSDRGLSSGEDYRFHHATLRQAAYEALAPRRRGRLHGRVARAAEQVYKRAPDRVADAIGAHWEAAGEPGRAFAWALRAGQAARARGQWPDALAAFERARRAADAAPEAPEEGDGLEGLLGLGEAYHAAGRLHEAEAVLADAVAHARSAGRLKAEATGLLLLGRTQASLGLYRGALSSTEASLAAFERAGDGDGAALARIHLATVRVALGEYEAAAPLLDGLVGDGPVGALATGVLGWARALQSRYAEGARLLERALAHYEGAGDLRQQAHLLRRLQWPRLASGEYEAAVALALRARDLFHVVGDAFGEAKAHMAVGQARLGQGLYDEAEGYLRRTLDALKTLGDAHCEAEVLWLLGRAATEDGRTDEAEGLLTRALELIRDIGDRDDEFRFLTDAARLHLATADAAQALAEADAAAAIAASLHNRDGEGAALAERARALARLGRPGAVEAARSAVSLLDATASSERWRGYRALAAALAADASPAAHGEEVQALQRAVGLLTGIRDQLPPNDRARRAAATRAHAEPARALHGALLREGRMHEAEALAAEWSLSVEPTDAPLTDS